MKPLEDFFSDALVLDLNDQIVEKTIILRRETKIKIPDALIESTALIYDLSLITRNTSDFKSIKGLQLIDPYTLQ